MLPYNTHRVNTIVRLMELVLASLYNPHETYGTLGEERAR
jgi:hypothetical protein